MTKARYLIVTADDFGQSGAVNRGIIEAHEKGIVTSTSLMVRWEAAAEAALYARGRRQLAVGWHFEAGEWIFQDGEWVPLYEVAPLGDSAALRKEALRQLETFRKLMGGDPTHIDSHQHVHLQEPVSSILQELARNLGVPLRHSHPSLRYCGDFYGQTTEGIPIPGALSPEALIRILQRLPEGWTELACHPGRGTDLKTMYVGEREMELQALCDPTVRAAIQDADILLRSFREFQ